MPMLQYILPITIVITQLGHLVITHNSNVHRLYFCVFFLRCIGEVHLYIKKKKNGPK
jgi:hypothetical protein